VLPVGCVVIAGTPPPLPIIAFEGPVDPNSPGFGRTGPKRSHLIPYETGYHLKLYIEWTEGISIHQSRRSKAFLIRPELFPATTINL